MCLSLQKPALLANNNTPFKDSTNKCHILLKNPLTASSTYIRMAEKKAHLVVKLIDDTVSRETLIQLLTKLLTQATDLPKKFE